MIRKVSYTYLNYPDCPEATKISKRTNAFATSTGFLVPIAVIYLVLQLFTWDMITASDYLNWFLALLTAKGIALFAYAPFGLRYKAERDSKVCYIKWQMKDLPNNEVNAVITEYKKNLNNLFKWRATYWRIATILICLVGGIIGLKVDKILGYVFYALVVVFSAFVIIKEANENDKKSKKDKEKVIKEKPLNETKKETIESQTTTKIDYKYCRICGAKIPHDSNFCEKCGTKVIQ